MDKLELKERMDQAWRERFDKLFDPSDRPVAFRGSVAEWDEAVAARVQVDEAIAEAVGHKGKGSVRVTIDFLDGSPQLSFEPECLSICVERPCEGGGPVRIGSQVARGLVCRLAAFGHGMPTRTE